MADEIKSIIVLNKDMTREYDINFDDVIEPLQIEDWEAGINTISFSVPLFSSAQVISGGQIILIPDEEDDLQPYQVIKTDIIAHEIHTLKVDCEHLFYELGDGLPRSYNRVNDTAEIALAFALENERWQVGNVDATITDLQSYSGTYQNPLQILRQIESDFDCRLKFRAELGTTSITGLYVDMELIDDEFSGQRFEFGHNLEGIDITVDHSEVKTALTGISPSASTDPVTGEAIDLTFADAEWAIADGDAADKPLNQTWVGNESARLLYGIYNPDTGLMEHRHGVYDSSAAQTADALLHATWLIGTRRHFSPKVNVEATIADLSKMKIVDIKIGEDGQIEPVWELSVSVSLNKEFNLTKSFILTEEAKDFLFSDLLGDADYYTGIQSGSMVSLDHEKLKLGNICYVIAEGEGLLAAVDVRIVRIERYLKDPDRTIIILGDMFFTSSDYLRDLEDELEEKTRAALPSPDRGPGVTVTIASEDTSKYPDYADIIIPTGFKLDSYFEEAMDRISATYGGHILILEGEYTYEDTMVIDKNNVTITGQGEGTVIELADSAADDTYAFLVDSKAGFKISDLVLDGNRANQTRDNIAILLNSDSYLPSDWAWYNIGAISTNASNDTNHTFGWGFTATEDIIVDKFRMYAYHTQNYKVDLWDVATETKLATKTFACTAGEWTEVDLDTSVTLTNGKAYVISYDHNANDRTYLYDVSAVPASEFNEYLTFGASVFTEGLDTFPSTTWVDELVAGIPDFGTSQGSRSQATDFSIRNITTKNYDFGGIKLLAASEGEVINCKSINTWVGLDIRGDSNLRIQGNEFNDCDTLGIYAIFSNDLLIQNNSLLDCDNMGMLLGNVTDSSIVGNTCKQGASSGVFTLAGIGLVDSENNNIVGNVSNNNKYWGISVEGSNYNAISNNICNGSENASGIIISGNSVYNTIQGNKCQSNAIYGIKIDAGSNNNQVTNNDLYGNTSGGLSDSGTGTITAAGNRA